MCSNASELAFRATVVQSYMTFWTEIRSINLIEAVPTTSAVATTMTTAQTTVKDVTNTTDDVTTASFENATFDLANHPLRQGSDVTSLDRVCDVCDEKEADDSASGLACDVTLLLIGVSFLSIL